MAIHQKRPAFFLRFVFFHIARASKAVLVMLNAFCERNKPKKLLIHKPEKTADTQRRHYWFPLRSEGRNSQLMTCHYHDLGSTSVLIGRTKRATCFNQSEALARSLSVWNFCALSLVDSTQGNQQQNTSSPHFPSGRGVERRNASARENEPTRERRKAKGQMGTTRSLNQQWCRIFFQAFY